MSKDRCTIHKWRRRNLTKNPNKPPYIVYACVKCPSYKPIELMIGERFECWRCGGNFIFSAKHKELARPHCDGCTKSSEKKKKIDEALESIIQDLTKGL